MNAVEELKKLKPKKFKYKGSNKVCYGFIAQELQEVFPDMVGQMQNGYLGIYYCQLPRSKERGL